MAILAALAIRIALETCFRINMNGLQMTQASSALGPVRLQHHSSASSLRLNVSNYLLHRSELLLSANRLIEALECLETGRAIISQLLDDRSDLSHSQRANRHQNLVNEVNATTCQTTLDFLEASLRKRRQ
ncbi:Cis-aconitate decarboxylase [Fusarium oxysporum f. sp. albedinis]|nr:Cis-aconitate decarboxylase [Fusarium oxysporum f. sp. albedinis]